jgi:transketolase
MIYEELKKTAWDRRLEVLEMVFRAKAGHIGGSFSCMDILVTLYYHWFNTEKILNGGADRDRFILSKGHCAEALYTVLADRGFFSKKDLEHYTAFDSPLAEHPTKRVAGVEIASGALGHGLSVGLGLAYALRQDGNPARVVVLMGDGEQAEGSVWEAAMAAAKFSLENLTAIIDRNFLEISGNTEEVMPLEKLEDKYGAFGWDVRCCNGHEPASILGVLNRSRAGRPVLIIAATVKGYGSAVLENKAESHHMIPSEDQYLQIKNDLLRQRGHCDG